MVAALFGLRQLNRSYVVIVNDSATEIASGEVRIAGVKKSLANMKLGDERILRYHVRNDDNYVMRVRFKNGKELRQHGGYATGGARAHDKITISASEISLQQSF